VALYFEELWVKDPTPAKMKEFVQMMSAVFKEGPAAVGAQLPVRFVAGPWASNEEAKIFLILDVADHTPSYTVFSKLIAQGLVEKRRFTPIVEWSEVEKMVTQL